MRYNRLATLFSSFVLAASSALGQATTTPPGTAPGTASTPGAGAGAGAGAGGIGNWWWGGFKRSSQHLDGGSCDGEAEAEIGSVWTGTIAIARPSAGRGPRPTGTVLGGHCCGLVE